MGIHNGFGIHYFLIFQSLNQLNKIYTKDHSFLAHCRNSIFYAPGAGEIEAAKTISEICGKESVQTSSISYSGSRGALGYNNANLSSQNMERNLVNADEIIKLPLDRFLLLCQGLPPYVGVKNVFYDDPVFKSRICDPPFTDREGAVKAAKEAIAHIKKSLWFNNLVYEETEQEKEARLSRAESEKEAERQTELIQMNYVNHNDNEDTFDEKEIEELNNAFSSVKADEWGKEDEDDSGLWASEDEDIEQDADQEPKYKFPVKSSHS